MIIPIITAATVPVPAKIPVKPKLTGVKGEGRLVSKLWCWFKTMVLMPFPSPHQRGLFNGTICKKKLNKDNDLLSKKMSKNTTISFNAAPINSVVCFNSV